MAAMHHRHKRKVDIELWDNQITRADRLFADELAWLCEYATPKPVETVRVCVTCKWFREPLATAPCVGCDGFDRWEAP